MTPEADGLGRGYLDGKALVRHPVEAARITKDQAATTP